MTPGLCICHFQQFVMHTAQNSFGHHHRKPNNNSLHLSKFITCTCIDYFYSLFLIFLRSCHWWRVLFIMGSRWNQGFTLVAAHLWCQGKHWGVKQKQFAWHAYYLLMVDRKYGFLKFRKTSLEELDKTSFEDISACFYQAVTNYSALSGAN